MLVFNVPATQRKQMRRRQIFITAVIANTTALLLRGDFDRPADAAVLFAPMTTYIKTQATAFLGATTLTAVQPLLLALLDLIPWSIILIVGAIISWQSYKGYELYEREDLSGMGKCVLNILVLVALTFTSAKITDAMVT
jgi:hypothetical protein